MEHFNRIAGYEAEKKELQVIAEQLINRQTYIDRGLTLPKGLIISGERGMGKKLFLEVLVAQTGRTVRRVDVATALDGQDVFHRIRKAFIKGARSTTPSILFIPDIDRFLCGRQVELYEERNAALLTQLIDLLDGTQRFGHVFFVATCKDREQLPAALLETGRMDKSILLAPPALPARAAVLQMYMEASSCRFALRAEEIARLTSGFSCAALKALVSECVFASDEENHASEALIREKVAQLGVAGEIYEGRDLKGIVQAVRNVGAFVVARDYSKGNYVLSLKEPSVGNCFLQSVITELDGDNERWDYDDDDEDEGYGRKSKEAPHPFSKNDLLATLTALLGGYAAEELVLHKVHHTNARRMWVVNRILMCMAECGMLGFDLLYSDMYRRELEYSPAFSERMERAFAQVVEKCYEKARGIVAANERLIKKLAPILAMRGCLDKCEADELIFEFGGIA